MTPLELRLLSFLYGSRRQRFTVQGEESLSGMLALELGATTEEMRSLLITLIQSGLLKHRNTPAETVPGKEAPRVETVQLNPEVAIPPAVLAQPDTHRDPTVIRLVGQLNRALTLLRQEVDENNYIKNVSLVTLITQLMPGISLSRSREMNRLLGELGFIERRQLGWGKAWHRVIMVGEVTVEAILSQQSPVIPARYSPASKPPLDLLDERAAALVELIDGLEARAVRAEAEVRRLAALVENLQQRLDQSGAVEGEVRPRESSPAARGVKAVQDVLASIQENLS